METKIQVHEAADMTAANTFLDGIQTANFLGIVATVDSTGAITGYVITYLTNA